MTTSHTLTPWRLGTTKKDGLAYYREIETCQMGHCSIGFVWAPAASPTMIERSEANAAMILEACNGWFDPEALRARISVLESA